MACSGGGTETLETTQCGDKNSSIVTPYMCYPQGKVVGAAHRRNCIVSPELLQAAINRFSVVDRPLLAPGRTAAAVGCTAPGDGLAFKASGAGLGRQKPVFGEVQHAAPLYPCPDRLDHPLGRSSGGAGPTPSARRRTGQRLLLWQPGPLAAQPAGQAAGRRRRAAILAAHAVGVAGRGFSRASHRDQRIPRQGRQRLAEQDRPGPARLGRSPLLAQGIRQYRLPPSR